MVRRVGNLNWKDFYNSFTTNCETSSVRSQIPLSSLLSPYLAHHLHPLFISIPSTIQLGQIRSVNILSENEKPFSNYHFFTIGTAARVYYFCVKVILLPLLPPPHLCLSLSHQNENILSQWIDALLQYQLRMSPASVCSGPLLTL
jgi:hypothetical protein